MKFSGMQFAWGSLMILRITSVPSWSSSVGDGKVGAVLRVYFLRSVLC